jgi:antitoxin component YwqK of YwqJK toxin-antitoxin module
MVQSVQWRCVSVCFCCLVLFVYCGHKHSSPNDVERHRLKGQVQLVSTKLLTKAGVYNDSIAFNKQGYISSQVSYNPDGSLIRRLVFDYSDTLKVGQSCYVRNDSLAYTLVYSYGNDGLLDTSYIIDAGKPRKKRSSFVYDSKGLLMNEVYHQPDGSIESEMAHFYNADGLREKTAVDDRFANSKYTVTRKFNRNRKVVEEQVLSDGNTVVKTKKLVYGNDLQPKSVSVFSGDGVLTNSAVFVYDEHGNTLSVVHTQSSAKPDTIAYVYKYDVFGNWIFRSMSENGVEKEIALREVLYY